MCAFTHTQFIYTFSKLKNLTKITLSLQIFNKFKFRITIIKKPIPQPLSNQLKNKSNSQSNSTASEFKAIHPLQNIISAILKTNSEMQQLQHKVQRLETNMNICMENIQNSQENKNRIIKVLNKRMAKRRTQEYI